jgi:hypothetical protein
MDKKPNNRILGMTQMQLLILIAIGGLLLLTIILFGGYIIYDMNRSKVAAALPPTFQPTQPTYTPYPTNAPLPTFTPVVEVPQVPFFTPTTLAVISPTTEFSVVVGGSAIRLDSWLVEVMGIRSDPGKDNTRQMIVVFGYITNKGTQTDTFTPLYKIVLRDSQGRLYEADFGAGFDVLDKYNVELSAMMSPDARLYTAFVYDVPSSEKSFSLVPGNIVSDWSGDVSFTLP